jgi:hypothetical protein
MATKNDITGDCIASRPVSEAYRSGWDRIFRKQSAHLWLKDPEFCEIQLVDADGWTQNDGITLDSPITKKEFETRLALSTIIAPLTLNKND